MKDDKLRISCDEAVELMFSYLEGESSAAEMAKLTLHLESCESCRAELEERRRILDTIKLAEYPVPNELHSNVMEMVEKTPQEKVSLYKRYFAKGNRFVPPIGTIAAACAVFVLLLATRTGVNSPSEIGVGDAPSLGGRMITEGIGEIDNAIEPALFDAPELTDESVRADEKALQNEVKKSDESLKPLDRLLAVELKKAEGKENVAIINCYRDSLKGFEMGDKITLFIGDKKFDGFLCDGDDASVMFDGYIEILDYYNASYKAYRPEAEEIEKLLIVYADSITDCDTVDNTKNTNIFVAETWDSNLIEVNR